MATLTPHRSVTELRPVPVPTSQQIKRRLSVLPRMLFSLAAACMILTPVIAVAIDDGGSRHLDSGYFFLVGLAPGVAASAVMLGAIAEPARGVSRKLHTCIGIALGTLLVDVVGTALVPFLAATAGSVSILGAIEVVVAYLALIGYTVAFVGTLIVDRRSRH